MKKIHVLGVAMVAMFAMGVVGAVSASAATIQWLAAGAVITTPQASKTVGEITLGSTNGLGLGIKSSVLCSGEFIGTVGPVGEDLITEVLSLTGTKIELPTILTCSAVETCTSGEVAPVHLPWLTELTLSGTVSLDVLLNGGKGDPGWEVVCKTALGTVEETCTSASQSSKLENDAGENDVLGSFVKEQTATCSLGGANTGFVESSAGDGAGLISLTSGAALSVSEV
jgi:hypothetical protein